MKKYVITVTALLSCILATEAMAGPADASPAFVQQASGGNASAATLDTAAIFAPSLQILSAQAQAGNGTTSGNLATTYQTGMLNTASIEQDGGSHVGMIVQAGYANAASISQSGTGQRAFVSQQGNNNIAIIRQR